MDLKSTITIILKDLEEARSIIDDLGSYPDVPAIQIELAKSKVRSAEEVIKMLIEMDLSPAGSPSVKNMEEPPATESKRDISSEIIEPDKPVNLAEIIALDENEDIIDQIVQPGKLESDNTSGSTGKSEKGQIVADKFVRQSSINEKIAYKRHDDDASDVRKLKPLSDISEAIGLNDRFLFVRELFDGNQELYSDTLKRLNSVTNLDDAFDLLTKATTTAGNNEAFDQLIDLVRRKISKS